MVETHYSVLEVSPSASYDEIKISFHRLARSCHPDKKGKRINSNDIDDDDGKPTDRFLMIQQAWEVLRDEERRKEYDHDLLQQDLYEKSRTSGALEVDCSNDLREAIDEDTEEPFFIYDCRCGEEIHISIDDTQRKGLDNPLVDCPGCCFVYRIVRR
jgi:diphthamide biosynthesis protein 4